MLTEFRNFPEEQEVLGRILIAYGEIEWALVECLRHILDIEISAAVRILFRVRGEGARMQVADAIARPAFMKIGLGPKWGNAFGAAKVCKDIRNQYAHCHWRVLDDGFLRFMNLDDEAGTVAEGAIKAKLIALNLDLLRSQDQYFGYALDWLYYLAEEYRKRAGRSSSHALTEPKSIAAPLLYIRP